MPEIKLKPCPFCGSEPHMEVVAAHKHVFVDMPDCDGEAFVFCNNCSAAVSGQNEQEAAEAWNRRADEVNEPLTLEELQQMDGEPVWLVSKINNTGEWGILRVHETSNSWFIGISGSCTVYGKDTYEKEWLAYRHKQQEGE